MDEQRVFRVAVIGAGPAGLYAADELARKTDDVAIDVLDRLPTPYGLIRYGVAPDHPRIKAIARALQRTLERPNVRFLGDVEIGSTLTPSDLRDCYDAVIYATGAPAAKVMGVPGEHLPGSYSASSVVSWYGGHPDSVDLPDEERNSAVVVGAGNVALDVARILIRPVGELAQTDMPSTVLDTLGATRITDVHVVCRRGPVEAKFTAKELAELGETTDVDVRVDEAALPSPGVSHGALIDANIATLRTLATNGNRGAPRRIHFHFWHRPVEILGDGRVEAVRLVSTRPDDGGESVTVRAGLVVSAIGYRGARTAGLPFDEENGVIPNEAGRILGDDGAPLDGWYVAGWAKRGPTGVVGTNRACAAGTVASLLVDHSLRPTPKDRTAVEDLLSARGVCPVTYDGWRAIDAGEIALGQDNGRARTKITAWERLRDLGSQPRKPESARR